MAAMHETVSEQLVVLCGQGWLGVVKNGHGWLRVFWGGDFHIDPHK